MPLEVQFADYALWQHEVLGDGSDSTSVIGTQLAYWTDKLADLPEVLTLPFDRPRPLVASQRGGRVGAVIPAEIGDRVRDLAHTDGSYVVLVDGTQSTVRAISSPVIGLAPP